MAMHESGEMYLETIYVLSQESPDVRAIDVGRRMGFSKPSVSRALGLLKRDGYVVVDEHGGLRLTKAGEECAKRIYERHVVLTELFQNLGVSAETAADDACRIEHYMSDETFNAIKAHVRQYGSATTLP
ncbi:MAG: metal-dependent transcriptional regulator [Coriobacteriales bacterium]|nr:metal-dependent transcriptional regulator [Coriobacteriales bacterium]